MPQVPPPPQADGKKTFWLFKVLSTVLPDSISMASPLMSRVTGPEGIKRALAWRRMVTKARITDKKTAMLMMIMVDNAKKVMLTELSC